MTADDRGVSVPEAHIDAVAWLVDEWLNRMHGLISSCNHHAEAEEMLTSTDPAVLDALAWAVTRTPEGRDKVLAALVETGTLTEEWRVAFADSVGGGTVAATTEADAREWATGQNATARRHLLTEWTEVEP